MYRLISSIWILYMNPLHYFMWKFVLMFCAFRTYSTSYSHSSLILDPWKVTHTHIQDVLHLLWNTKVHHHVHKKSPLDLTLSKMNSVHALPLYISNSHFNIIHSSILLLSMDSFFQVFWMKFCIEFSHPLCMLYALPIWAWFENLTFSDKIYEFLNYIISITFIDK
jgi:hypothetical protein